MVTNVQREKTICVVNANLPIFLKKYCSFLRQQMLNYLAFIDRLMHFRYILSLIFETFSYLKHDFNQFYEEGYVKFSVSVSMFQIYWNFV